MKKKKKLSVVMYLLIGLIKTTISAFCVFGYYSFVTPMAYGMIDGLCAITEAITSVQEDPSEENVLIQQVKVKEAASAFTSRMESLAWLSKLDQKLNLPDITGNENYLDKMWNSVNTSVDKFFNDLQFEDTANIEESNRNIIEELEAFTNEFKEKMNIENLV